MNDKKNDIAVPEEIRKEIGILLHDRFDMPKNFIPEGGDDTFFGLRGLLEPRELTYLTYMLETRYGIQFGMKEYDDSRFYSLIGLSEIVAGMMAEKSFQEVKI